VRGHASAATKRDEFAPPRVAHGHFLYAGCKWVYSCALARGETGAPQHFDRADVGFGSFSDMSRALDGVTAPQADGPRSPLRAKGDHCGSFPSRSKDVTFCQLP
jgi:hypothetical protein